MHYYLHIPFCRQKCPYCKFALTPIFDDVKKRRYLGYLKKEIREYFLSSCRDLLQSQVWEKNIQNLLSEWKRDFPTPLPLRSKWHTPKTIYFWWWTPSVLSLDEVREILECFRITEDSNTPTLQHSLPEMSFECNPEDITSEYVSWLLDLGMNRLSIGVQSLNDETLKTIHRSDRESIFHALEWVKSSLSSFWTKWRIHVPNILDPSLSSGWQERKISLNIDFILGLPHARIWETLENIRELHERFPCVTHTSVYMLEDGLYPQDWKKYSISEAQMEEEYAQICKYFDSLGWHHYEISSWAKPGYECHHNMWYWDHTDTRGFGLSATSYVWWRRWTNSDLFAGYYRWDIIDTEILTEDEKNLENMIHELRTFRLSDSHFPDGILDELEWWWLIERKNHTILLTPAWIFRENTILSRFIEK